MSCGRSDCKRRLLPAPCSKRRRVSLTTSWRRAKSVCARWLRRSFTLGPRGRGWGSSMLLSRRLQKVRHLAYCAPTTGAAEPPYSPAAELPPPIQLLSSPPPLTALLSQAARSSRQSSTPPTPLPSSCATRGSARPGSRQLHALEWQAACSLRLDRRHRRSIPRDGAAPFLARQPASLGYPLPTCKSTRVSRGGCTPLWSTTRPPLASCLAGKTAPSPARSMGGPEPWRCGAAPFLHFLG